MERCGLGTYGAVYRAVAIQGSSRPVALKLALHPGDERFAREVELLSRIHHPSVPRLLDHGSWLQPGALPHPYLVMEWVEGVSLYEWAHVRRPTSRQVLHALANLARALAATHAAGGVHRDVKGDNVLVRAEDGRVFLTDFGSGHYVGAATLTSPPFPPGTPPYRSPEAWRSVQLPWRASTPPYAPGPADDVFALGMTAYRLVTGDYPPTPAPMDAESRVWSLEGPGPQPVRAVNVRCCAELSELVSRMLSVRPEARGSARELAKALEHAARKAGPQADVPLFDREGAQSEDAEVAHRHDVPRATGRLLPSWLVAASLGGAVALGAGWLLSAQPGEEAEPRHASAPDDGKDGGTVAVGDTALTAPVPVVRKPSAWSSIAVEPFPKPIPGQVRPDATGRCPGKEQVPINGGCWVKLAISVKDCDEDYYVYKGACYGPAIRKAPPSTSSPAADAGHDIP
ncbi:serine/threonine protein kinase [Pyxidicoccus xibeiensis]|uniref:serine/threonine protein kinase n=1 Tax=Pyxidicoccus xibeiensis TaxID=2906759 RepID=UPI0020A80084|nr:serine/threonine-protein kinase [Pyxidicoccus xibeiensis]MCP3138117.1 serine/threonine protein kinase [Pyxidicoccus xibeiensis]